MWKSGSIFMIFLTGVRVSCITCGPQEYLTHQGRCCPKCEAGSYVLRHCEDSSVTACASCPPLTFTDEPNGLQECKSCTVCLSDIGLRLKRSCSPTSDTLCEPLEGHWCTDPIKDGCRRAVEHTKCSPGQYIKEKGGAYSDTVCGDCADGTHSDAPLLSCRTHTQ